MITLLTFFIRLGSWMMKKSYTQTLTLFYVLGSQIYMCAVYEPYLQFINCINVHYVVIVKFWVLN